MRLGSVCPVRTPTNERPPAMSNPPTHDRPHPYPQYVAVLGAAIGEMQYGDTSRLAYVRGPEGIIVALAEQLG